MITLQTLADELSITVDEVADSYRELCGLLRVARPEKAICDADANKIRTAAGAPAVPDRSRTQGRPERWSERDITELIDDEAGRW